MVSIAKINYGEGVYSRCKPEMFDSLLYYAQKGKKESRKLIKKFQMRRRRANFGIGR